MVREEINQVRLYAKSALNGFDTLCIEDAIENAKCDLRALLAYLRRADDALGVLGVESVEVLDGDEGTIRQCDKPSAG